MIIYYILAAGVVVIALAVALIFPTNFWFMLLTCLFTLAATSMPIIDFIGSSKEPSKRLAIFISLIGIVGLAGITFMSQLDAENANNELRTIETVRHQEILGEKTPPTLEVTFITKRETPINTVPIYFNPDSIEYFVDVEIKLWNESPQLHLKNIDCVVEYPNDYAHRKLKKYNGIFSYEQYQQYYAPSTVTPSINIGVLPIKIHKVLSRFYLPTISKKHHVTVDVSWNNGFYRANLVFEPSHLPKNIIPDEFKSDFTFKLVEPVNFIVADSISKPKYIVYVGAAKWTSKELEIKIKSN